VGAQLWDPPADHGDLSWLDEPGDPWVLVTTSTEYQADEQLARAAVEALRDEPVRVLLTLADAYDTAGIAPEGNLRVERFVPHGPVLERAAAVVSHSGRASCRRRSPPACRSPRSRSGATSPRSRGA
jgi:UDP:flavonoid glycosyltransferase YjiC (YdhE family)